MESDPELPQTEAEADMGASAPGTRATCPSSMFLLGDSYEPASILLPVSCLDEAPI